MEVFEGNPVGKAIWDFVWKLPIMKRGEQGTPIQFGDVAHVLRKNIEQIYGPFCSRTCLDLVRQAGGIGSLTSIETCSTTRHPPIHSPIHPPTHPPTHAPRQ